MFCKNCGKPTEGEQTLCPECAQQAAGLTNETPVQPVEHVQPVEYAQPAAPAQDTFQLNTPEQQPAKKGKKTGLIIGVAAAAAVAAIALVLIFCWNGVSAFFDRTFLSPEDYLVKVESNAVAELTGELTQAYGTSMANTEKNAAQMEMHLTVGDEILSLLETALQQQGMEMEMDWLSDIKLVMDTNSNDDAVQASLGVGLGDDTILTADVIYDIAGSMIYLAIPEVSDAYLSVDMGEQITGEDVGMIMQKSLKLQRDLLKAMPSEAEMNDMIDRYVKIALSQIKNVEKESDKITVDGVSQSVVVLKAKITEKDLYAIAAKMLEEAEDDKVLKKVLTAMSDYTNAMNELSGYAYEEVDLYQEFVSTIPDALEELEWLEENADKSNYLKLNVYVDMNGDVRGHELTVYTNGEKEMDPISYITVVKGNTTYTEAELAEVVITGEKTEKKGVSAGFYELTVGEQKVGELEFENVTENGGTLRLIPSEEVMSQILEDSGIPTALLGDKLGLELSYAENAYDVKILVDSKTLIGLSLSAAVKEGGSVSVPKDALDATDQNDVMEWIGGLDFSGMISAMEKADVPQELVDAVKEYVDMLQYYMS